jgi:plastocyanin
MKPFLSMLVLTVLLTATSAAQAGETDAAAPITASMDADGVQRATLTLDSYSYTPSHLIVTAGRPVELTLVSVSSLVPHNLVLNDPASGLSLKQDVGAGKTVKLTFTPTQPGTFAFFCDKKPPFMSSHRAKGMEGKLEVRPAAAS